MDIRLLQMADAESYRELRLEALQSNPEAFGSSYEEEKEYNLEVYKNRFKSKDSLTFGAFEKEKLIGTVTLFRETKVKMKHRANIFAMYVTADKRGSGIGRRLLTEAIQKAKELDGVEQIYLTVMAANEPAKKLYASFGFEIYGKEKRALKIGDSYYDEEHMVIFF